MRDRPALIALLPTLPVQPFQGVLYRAVTLEALYGFHHNPPYPQVRPLYNLGAPATGARYTPIGGPPSLYLAAAPETATAEVNQVYARLRRQNPPVLLCSPTACSLLPLSSKFTTPTAICGSVCHSPGRVTRSMNF